MKQLEKILRKYSFPRRGIVSVAAIEEIENQVGFSLPPDYKFYLENYRGSEEFIGLELITLWDLDDLLTRNRDYRIMESLPHTLGIGNNPGGEFIAIEYMGDDDYRIVLSPFIDLDRQYHIEVGATFTEMLTRLDDGKEWLS